MHRFLVLSLVLLFATGISTAHAKIFRIGFAGRQVAGVDYANFDATVHDAAAAGDTIQFYQYSGIGSNLSITKRLVFLGMGYMLDKNPGLQSTSVSNTTNTFYFDSAAAGSVVKGLNIDNLFITADNITISRCKISSTTYLGRKSNGTIRSVSNVSFIGNFITGEFNDYTACNNLYICNNIITGYISLDASSGLFANNIITYYYYHHSLFSFIVKNNIFSNYYCITAPGSIFQNNLFSISSCSNISGSGNKFGVNMFDVFVNWNSSSISADNQLVLKAGSPAIGAGLKNDGTVTDAGVFGGEPGYVYKLSGIPSIPSVYQLSAPSQNASTNIYTINIGVRSNN